jgi:FkbM family methyltransferase
VADEVVDTPFGKFLIHPRDGIGSTLKAGTCWDGPGFLQPIAVEHGRLGEWGTTILDVGANIGAWTVWLARMGAWRVVACEPVEQTRAYLRANLDLNKDVCATRVVVVETAAYDRCCQMSLVQPFDLANMGGSALRVDAAGPIAALPLDAYKPLFGQRVSLIKTDCQGCDFAALRGLAETIAAWHPVIVFEWEEPETLPDGGGWLTQQGYQVLPWPSQPHNYLAIWQGGQ